MRSRIIERNMFFGAGGKIFENARGLRKNMTFAERIMWDELKNRRQFKFRFRRQHPVDIFILDFYCHELKLAIEIDGDIHLEKDVAEYDDRRAHYIEKLGIKLLGFTNEQVKNCRSNVIKEILETIKNIKNNSVE